MELDSLEIPGDFDGQVRLFPLPNLVLYPGCVQPLHIFESRYQEMLEDAVDDDNMLAIATLLPGYEVDYHSRPPIADHVCVGHVVTHEKTDEGTYNLVLVGVRRAAIQTEITPVRSYRRAQVEIVDELDVARAELARRLGRRLTQQISAVGPSAAKLEQAFAQEKISLASLTDLIAFHFPLDLELKLQLLADPDPCQRAELLINSVQFTTAQEPAADERDNDQATPRRRFPPRFGAN